MSELSKTVMSQIGTNAAQGAIQSGIQSLFNLGLMKRENRYQKEMMKLQDQYQRKMMLDNMSLVKESLMRAGYSTADPSGTGTSAPTVSAPSSSATGQVSAPSMPGIDIASVRQINSQARLNEIEAEYLAQKREGEIGKLKAEIKQIQDTLPENIKLIQANTKNALASAGVSEKQLSEIDANIALLKANTESFNIDNKYKPERLSKENQKLGQEVALLIKDNKIKQAEARLADYGILMGLDGLGNLLSITLSGNAGHVVGDLLSGILSPFAAIPGAIGAFFKSLLDGMKDMLPGWMKD